MELAKEAAKAALGMLNEQHRFGLVAFDWHTHEIVPLQFVREQGRLADRVDRIEASAQTNFYPALEACLDQLSEVQSEVKHVILVSDGRTYPDEYERLVRRMRQEEITVSTVAIGVESDRELLADIADWGRRQRLHDRGSLVRAEHPDRRDDEPTPRLDPGRGDPGRAPRPVRSA